MIVTLEDCKFMIGRSRKYHGDEPDDLLIELPRYIDITGIREKLCFYKVGHEVFENEHGALYVACDRRARFWPDEEIYRPKWIPYWHHVMFESADPYSWAQTYGGKLFKIMEHFRLTKGFKVPESGPDIIAADKEEIINRIKKDEDVSTFLNSFFNWIDEFAREFGEEHFKYFDHPGIFACREPLECKK